MTLDAVPARERALGGVYAVASYVLWGFMPLYFLMLAPTGPWEIVALRVVLAFVFCVILLLIVRGGKRIRVIMRQRRLLVLTAVASLLIYANWQLYLIATLTGHVLETSLGYFINPMLTVLLGVLVLRERLRITQWLALGIGAVAVVVLIVGYGSFPWIALTLSVSFSVYGLVKKQIGPAVDPVSGLTLESFWLLPIGGVLLIVVGQTTGLTIGTEGVGHLALLSLTGVLTAVPLLLFAAGARRMSLTVLGLLQFIAPLISFIIGAWLLGEPMPVGRWAGFGLIWLALVVLSIDSIVFARRRRGVADVSELI